jgi:hypothetical protein
MPLGSGAYAVSTLCQRTCARRLELTNNVDRKENKTKKQDLNCPIALSGFKSSPQNFNLKKPLHCCKGFHFFIFHFLFLIPYVHPYISLKASTS